MLIKNDNQALPVGAESRIAVTSVKEKTSENLYTKTAKKNAEVILDIKDTITISGKDSGTSDAVRSIVERQRFLLVHALGSSGSEEEKEAVQREISRLGREADMLSGGKIAEAKNTPEVVSENDAKRLLFYLKDSIISNFSQALEAQANSKPEMVLSML